jgi:hypothetical protein
MGVKIAAVGKHSSLFLLQIFHGGTSDRPRLCQKGKTPTTDR